MKSRPGLSAAIVLLLIPCSGLSQEPAKKDPPPDQAAAQAKQDPQKQDQARSDPSRQDPPKQEPRPWREWCCYEKGRTEREGYVTIVIDMHHHMRIPEWWAQFPAQAPLIPIIPGLTEFKNILTPYLAQGKGGHIEVSDALHALVITDVKENIDYLMKILTLAHHAEPPVWVEAKVVEVRWDKTLQIGAEGNLNAASGLWLADASPQTFIREVRIKFDPTDATTGTPFQGSTFVFARDSGNRLGAIGGIIQSFVQRGRAQIHSAPKVLVKSDEHATIFAGEEVPYPSDITISGGGTTTSLHYRPTGVSLDVRPHISGPGMIEMHVKAEVNTVIGFVQIAATTQAPSFTVRRVESEVVVRDGEEIVIGGLFRKEKTTTRRGLPFLSDLPIVGYLFGKYEEDELFQEILFFIKPSVAKSEDELKGRVFDPDKK